MLFQNNNNLPCQVVSCILSLLNINVIDSNYLGVCSVNRLSAKSLLFLIMLDLMTHYLNLVCYAASTRRLSCELWMGKDVEGRRGRFNRLKL